MTGTKQQMQRIRQPRERVVQFQRHDPLCLGLPPVEGVPALPCTCGGKGVGYALVLDTKR